MFIKNDTRDDTHMRYENSYVRINTIWHHIEKIEKLTDTAIFFIGSRLVNGSWEIFPSTSFSLKDIDISFPKLGSILVHDIAMCITKKNSNSRKLTLCNDRVSISLLNKGKGTLSKEVLQALVSPVYTPVQEVQKRLLNKKDSVLSDSISVVYSGDVAEIYRGKYYLGPYIGGKITIRAGFKLFKQELEEVGLIVEVV